MTNEVSKVSKHKYGEHLTAFSVMYPQHTDRQAVGCIEPRNVERLRPHGIVIMVTCQCNGETWHAALY